MSTTSIKFKRGNKADLPKSAPSGTPLWCEDSHELYMGTGDGISKASKNDVINDNEHELNILGVLSDDLTSLRCDSLVKIQGNSVKAQNFIGNLNGNATCDENGDNIVETYERKSQKGAINGYAPLDAEGKIPLTNLPNIGANKELSNLTNLGTDKLNTSKMYKTGEVSSDPEGYAQLLAIKNDIFTKSIIDVAVSNNYSVTGSPTINGDIVQLTSNKDCICFPFCIPSTPTDFKICLKYIAPEECGERSVNVLANEAGFEGLRIQGDPGGTFTAYNYLKTSATGYNLVNHFVQTPTLSFVKGDAVYIEAGYSSESGFFIRATANGQTVENVSPSPDSWYRKSNYPFTIGAMPSSVDSDYYCSSPIDLSEFLVYVNDKLVYIPSLRIPCLEASNGTKIVLAENYAKVEKYYLYKGFTPYFTIDEVNQTFTLPKGELYGVLNKKANIDMIPIKHLGETITSAMPISDKNLALCDGRVIKNNDIYTDFVSLMNRYYNEKNYVISCYEAKGTIGEDTEIYIRGSLWSGAELLNKDGTPYKGTNWELKSVSFSYKPVYTDIFGDEIVGETNSAKDVTIHNPPEFLVSEEKWQALNTEHGECGRFGFNEEDSSVRLPNINPYSSNEYELPKFKYIVVSQLL